MAGACFQEAVIILSRGKDYECEQGRVWRRDMLLLMPLLMPAAADERAAPRLEYKSYGEPYSRACSSRAERDTVPGTRYLYE